MNAWTLRLRALLLVTTFSAPLGAAAADAPPELVAWIESTVPARMADAKLPGLSIAVVKDGQTIYAEGFGSRDPRRNLPATPDTLYGIGSITKSFVALGILQLADAGKLRLDDPVSRHVPFELGLPDKPITIHHLLTHSLGIPSLASSSVALYRGLGLETGVPLGSAADFYLFVNGARDEVVAPPGERFFYHNAAWRILGHIIQVRSGMPLHRYLKTHVIDALGMARTTLEVAAFSADADHIVPHRKDADGQPVPTAFPYPDPEDNPEFAFLSAAGGVLSSASEMTHYLNALLAQGRRPGGRLVGEESFERMQTLHIRQTDGHYGLRGYGYGLTVTPDFLGHTLLSHGGSILVSTAYMALVPDVQAGVIILGNGPGMSYGPLAEGVLAILMGHDPQQAVPVLRISEALKQLTGRYETYQGLAQTQVVLKAGLLHLRTTNPLTGVTSATPLIPVDDGLRRTDFYTWRNGLRSPIEFRVRDDGRVDLIVGRYRYRKVAPGS